MESCAEAQKESIGDDDTYDYVDTGRRDWAGDYSGGEEDPCGDGGGDYLG